MKFLNHIMLRVAISLSVVIGVWAVIFYYIIVDEVNDETDDVLEDYSVMIIQNFLSGEQMPTNDNGSNSTYYLRPVSRDSLAIAKSEQGFSNEDIYIKYKGESEPARVLRQVFMDADGNYYQVRVLTPTIDSDDLVEAIYRSLVALFLLLLILTLLINIFAIKSALNPLDRFMMWLHNSSVENSLLPSIERGNVREINELIAAVESFAQRSQYAFEQQKEFIGNASHELQTPIAICQNRLELLCDSGLTEKQMEDVAECLSTLSRLARLNRSLLMLSKIENGGFESSQVDLNALVESSVEQLQELYEHRHISVEVNQSGSAIIQANRELASTMIVNLVKNSYSHNVDGGRIVVDISSESLTVANSGVEGEVDSEKIFTRFYQGKSKSGSAGLGLAITHSICKLYGFKLGYFFADGLHRFQIKFK
ncbi:MAG: HAMP domain-containing sensor histidine kinase [Rikenellaceae bacterium]